MNEVDIRIEDYNYELPEVRIAKYPLPHRDSSKLLVYSDGMVADHTFRDLPDLLPEHSIMVFNDTKVVPARLYFRKPTGAAIEIFCLRPSSPEDYNLIFQTVNKCEWCCVIGNSRKWKNDVLHLANPQDTPGIDQLNLRATLLSKDGQTGLVRFEWDGEKLFSEVLDMCGNIPIPPYLNRSTEPVDLERYQTTYAHIRGSVAAPTAGLHFTDDVINSILQKLIDVNNVCLHVGAGTFLPVKSSNVAEHPMHREPFSVGIGLLRKLAAKSSDCGLTAVGTTSVRTLESLYYIGVSIIENGAPEDVRQWAPYDRDYDYSTSESLSAIIDYLERKNLDSIVAGTRIIIVPGFKFRLVDYLVTNFHQPESTLILLVSAFVGGDWRTIYNHALNNGYRFLSYGDSSFLKRR